MQDCDPLQKIGDAFISNASLAEPREICMISMSAQIVSSRLAFERLVFERLRLVPGACLNR
jgi:hypothetical protein